MISLVSLGLSRTLAAQHVGCAYSTIGYTARRDPEFRRQLDQAVVQSQLQLIASIRQQANRSWRAAAWLLERLYPHQYGRREPESPSRDEVQQAIDEVLQIVADIDDDDIRAQVERKLERVNDAFDRWAAEHRAPWERDGRPTPGDRRETEPDVVAANHELDREDPHSPRRVRRRKQKERRRRMRAARRWASRDSRDPTSLNNPKHWKKIDKDRRRELGIRDKDVPDGPDDEDEEQPNDGDPQDRTGNPPGNNPPGNNPSDDNPSGDPSHDNPRKPPPGSDSPAPDRDPSDRPKPPD